MSFLVIKNVILSACLHLSDEAGRYDITATYNMVFVTGIEAGDDRLLFFYSIPSVNKGAVNCFVIPLFPEGKE